MGSLRQFFSIPADFPRDLLEERPVRRPLSGVRWWLLGLVVLCLVPRVLMALRIGSICPDGVLYVELAKALEVGDFSAAFHEMRLNTFPIILMTLHRMGLGWEVAGIGWSIAVSCLTVLPLFGWARRMFDDRVALLACLLYAVHPKLIQWSPEVIRDPTFWLLFATSLYLMWRAVTEVRLSWYLLCGVTLALAFLTRFEGIFLLIPLLLWSFWRWRALQQNRGRVLGGTFLALAILPLFLVAINLIWLRNHPQWELSRMKPLELTHWWLQAMLGHPPDSAINVNLMGLAASQTRMSLGETFWTYLRVGEQGISPLFGLLMFGGTFAWLRIWTRREHQSLLPVALAIAAGMWIHLWCSQTSSNRYVLPIVIMGTVFAALGLWSCAGWLTRLAGRYLRFTPGMGWALAGLLLVVAATGLGEVLVTRIGFNYGEAALGRWLQQHCGRAPAVLGSEGVTIAVTYYAGGRSRSFPLDSDDQQILKQAREFHPDVVLLVVTNWMRKNNPDRYRSLLETMQAMGFQQVDPAQLPAECDRLLVLVRREQESRTVETASPTLSKTPANQAEVMRYR